MALRLEQAPEADLVYSDEDKVTMTGELVHPYYKPDFSPELLLTNNYLCHFAVIRATVFWDVGGFHEGVDGSQDFDLFLRVTEVARGVEHIPKILYHWRMVPGSTAVDSTAKGGPWRESSRQALRAAIARSLWQADVVDGLFPGTYRVKFAVDPTERVTIIIPTKDQVALLRVCLESIRQHTTHPNYEILVVSNNSEDEATYAYLEHAMRDGLLRFLCYDMPFNYAAINNFAVRHCDSPYLLLLNNDTEVVSDEWLTSMLEFAQHKDIGAVGAKLLYPDGTIQHAGVILGIGGVAGHIHRYLPEQSPGYFGQHNVIRNYSAVTAACLLTRREVWEAVGGFNEDLAVAFNDVDFCLKVRQAGYRIVYTPYAKLYHHESASRGSDSDPKNAERFRAEIAYMLAKWGPWLQNDPYYNPNLTPWRDDCSLTTLADVEAMQAFWRSFPSLGQSFSLRSSTLPTLRPSPQPCGASWSSDGPRAVTAAASSRKMQEMSRAETLLASVDRSARIIEIGPSYNPIAPKADGWNTSTLDHTTRASLVEKYRGHPGVDVDRIEEVDFVWTNGSVADAVPSDLHGTFDAFIASHVIEHTTDLVGFLAAAATLLAPSGVAILAIPDKRYCFDYFRPLTTTGEVLDAHTTGRTRHTRRILFDQMAYIVKNGGAGAWGQTPMQELQFYYSLEEASDAFSTTREDPDSPYVDMHAWQFTPASFELLLLELARLGKTDWQVERITPPTGCEFYVWLRRGGKAAAAALTVAEVNVRRLALLKQVLLQTREQIDLLLAGEPGPEQRHL